MTVIIECISRLINVTDTLCYIQYKTIILFNSGKWRSFRNAIKFPVLHASKHRVKDVTPGDILSGQGYFTFDNSQVWTSGVLRIIKRKQGEL
jgi:hypothetical protein